MEAAERMVKGRIENRGWARTSGLAALGVALVALGSWVSWTMPGTEVPQSGQTLAVVLIGAFYGARLGGLTLGIYLATGAAGLPVFADGAAGWTHLVGPTAGYLAGFLLAAVIVGWASDRQMLSRPGPALGLMTLAHAMILLLGWARLGLQIGPAEAYVSGVAPFLWGGLGKSVLAAGITTATSRSGASRRISSSANDASRFEM